MQATVPAGYRQYPLPTNTGAVLKIVLFSYNYILCYLAKGFRKFFKTKACKSKKRGVKEITYEIDLETGQSIWIEKESFGVAPESLLAALRNRK